MSCIIELPAQKKTDTWDGISEASLSSSGTEFADPLLLVVMSFYPDGETVASLVLSSAEAEITIDDAAAWQFTILPKTPIGLDVGFYSWKIQTTDDAGSVKTYVKGTIEILN